MKTDFKPMKIGLTIAGSDPCGGAGIQADLKTFEAFGLFGTSAITAVTVQNFQRFSEANVLTSQLVKNQIDAIIENFNLDCIKIGMIGSLENAKSISEIIQKLNIPIVFDPVLKASVGGIGLISKKDPDNKQSTELLNLFLPISTLITPNIPEFEFLFHEKFDLNNLEKINKNIQKYLQNNENCSILVKGGHSNIPHIDYLFSFEKEVEIIEGKKMEITDNFHGTGCTLSTAIAANLGLGQNLKKSIENAKEYLTNAIKFAPLNVPNKNRPLNHHFKL